MTRTLRYLLYGYIVALVLGVCFVFSKTNNVFGAMGWLIGLQLVVLAIMTPLYRFWSNRKKRIPYWSVPICAVGAALLVYVSVNIPKILAHGLQQWPDHVSHQKGGWVGEVIGFGFFVLMFLLPVLVAKACFRKRRDDGRRLLDPTP